MNSTKKIAFVISELKYSGAAKILTWIANRFSSKGYDITIITYLGKGKVYEISSTVEHISLSVSNVNKVHRSMVIVHELCKLINQEKFDLLVSFLPIEGMYTVIAGKYCRIPVVVCERSDPYFEKSFVANVARYFFRFANGAVFQTKGACEFFPRKLQERSVVIPNPVLEKGVYVEYGERENIISAASRLYIKQKRQDVLLKAFALVVEHNPTVKLLLIGDGPDEDKLKMMAKELNIANNVVFAGRQENVLKMVSKTKIFVLTSDYEGMPNALMEALSVGVPSISTDCSPGGARMLINENENGFIVTRGNTVQIAEKMLWLLQNESKAEHFATEALKINDIYSEERIFMLWEAYLDTFIKDK